MCNTWPSTCPPGTPRTHTHAESLAVSVSACADVDPAGQVALAVNRRACSPSVGAAGFADACAVIFGGNGFGVADGSGRRNTVSAPTISRKATSTAAPSAIAAVLAPALVSVRSPGASGPESMG